MNTNIFRAYDIRGLADADLTDDVVELIGKAYGTKLQSGSIPEGPVCIGRDVRLSSERIQNALSRGVRSTGLDVVHIGMVTTPITYFANFHLNSIGSIMITGSHNPIEYNGLKMNRGVDSIHGEEIQELRQLVENRAFTEGEGSLKELSISDAYKEMLLERIQLKKPLKIVIDAGNGTSGPVAPDVFQKLGCEVICLYCDPDGHFPNHLPDPTVEENIRALKQKVLQTGADMGLGYDGDSDRVGLVDDKGRAIFADQVLALLARDVLKRNKGGTVIYDVKCSRLVKEEILRLDGKPLMMKTGHSYIKTKMKEEEAPLAGEMSGHIFFKDGYYGFDDGIYVSLRIAQYAASQEKRVSELVDELPRYVSTPEIRISCSDETKFKVVEKLTSNFKESYTVNDIDGARVEFDDGWGLVRVSNTQPILVLRFEAASDERLKAIQGVFRKQLEAFPEVQLSEWKI